MILYAKEVKDKKIEKLKNEVDTFKTKPKLVIITIGEDKSSQIYVKNKIKLSSEIGIDASHLIYNDGVEQELVLKEIDKLNNDHTVNGIIVQLPLPKSYDEELFLSRVNPQKDVDAFSDKHVNMVYRGSNELLPCTVQGVIDLLTYYDIKIAGQNIVICGRSLIVGKPLFHALINMNATVSLCHSKTKNIKSYIDNADIFISAIGIPKHFTYDYFKDNPNISIIDVGISRVEKKIYGDVDFENIVEHVENISPVPKGVGVMTVANVVNNTIVNYKKMNESEF